MQAAKLSEMLESCSPTSFPQLSFPELAIPIPAKETTSRSSQQCDESFQNSSCLLMLASISSSRSFQQCDESFQNSSYLLMLAKMSSSQCDESFQNSSSLLMLANVARDSMQVTESQRRSSADEPWKYLKSPNPSNIPLDFQIIMEGLKQQGCNNI
ncbi:hypothetical protein AVEN_160648-1 [Araneus ventricosus]|uniref:Uncharacterized protein n=1 Tax=Araneus ventricosus TaxID=182803 RepID=A0A4Y2SG92_ARAVE|nr:hypothetical protein AVEN_160648-1 [Araneus ventricosus]